MISTLAKKLTDLALLLNVEQKALFEMISSSFSMLVSDIFSLSIEANQ